MPRMVTFRLNRDCREIAVNTDRVLYVSHYETGASCVHFSRECFVRVQGEMKDVVRRIETAAEAEDALQGPSPCADEPRGVKCLP